jgi:hypothetical protein
MKRVFVLDQSGSMDIIRDDTIGGYNSFVDSQKELGGTMSLYVFNQDVKEVYKDVPIETVEPLTRATFVPSGGTALLDALGHVLKTDHDQKVLVIILTDGEENSSRTYTKNHVKDLTDMRTKEGWDFVYLGANQDAFAVGQQLGINTNVNFDTNHTHDLFAALSRAVSQSASTGTQVSFA